MSTSASEFPKPYHLTVQDYYRMSEVGIFGPHERVELMEGEIIAMSPIGSLHAAWVNQLARLFIQKTSDEITVHIQNPIRLGDDTEPEPDLALLSPREKPYRKAHPTSKDILLIVEVAESSLVYDRDRKVPLYARYGIPEVWLVDLNSSQLTIYLEPSQDGYRKILRPARSECVSPALLPEVKVEFGTLFKKE